MVIRTTEFLLPFLAYMYSQRHSYLWKVVNHLKDYIYFCLNRSFFHLIHENLTGTVGCEVPMEY
jgi:hypothetical protein